MVNYYCSDNQISCQMVVAVLLLTEWLCHLVPVIWFSWLFQFFFPGDLRRSLDLDYRTRALPWLQAAGGECYHQSQTEMPWRGSSGWIMISDPLWIHSSCLFKKPDKIHFSYTPIVRGYSQNEDCLWHAVPMLGSFEDPTGQSLEQPGLISWLALLWAGAWTRDLRSLPGWSTLWFCTHTPDQREK